MRSACRHVKVSPILAAPTTRRQIRQHAGALVGNVRMAGTAEPQTSDNRAGRLPGGMHRTAIFNLTFAGPLGDEIDKSILALSPDRMGKHHPSRHGEVRHPNANIIEQRNRGTCMAAVASRGSRAFQRPI
jgi:hypothetical protein